MSIEYKDRGVLHKLTSTKKFRPQQSKNSLIKFTAKTALAAETTVLFAKDLAVNRFVGKETHIKFERRQNAHGKYRTHIKFVRAEATQRPKGVLHKAFGIGRFFEGDKPFQKNQKYRFKPKTVKGKIIYSSYGSSKFILKNAAKLGKSSLLASETALMSVGSAGLRQIRYKLRNSTNVHDSGRAAMAGLTALQTLNRGRKYLISYRRSRSAYKQSKVSYKSQKQQLKTAKIKYKSEKQNINLEKRELKVRLNSTSSSSIGHKKKLVINVRIKYQNKLRHSEKAVYKNVKKQKQLAKKELKQSKTVPVAALPLVPSAALAKQLTSTYARKAVYADTDNDFMQAGEKIARTASAVHRTAKPIKNKLQTKHYENQRNKLQRQRNRLNAQNSDLKKNKRKFKKRNKKSSQSVSERAEQAVKEAAKQAMKAVGDFAKFAVKLMGILLLPIIGLILVVCLLMMIFTSIADNSSYILGTYNAEDRHISTAIEHYTEIAYEVNQNIIKCGKSNEWRNGLKGLGVTSDRVNSYKDNPNVFKFGRSSYYSQNPSYDFDPDKLAAFMCAYYYEPDSEGNVANWEWNDDYDEVLQELFDTEYTFTHHYEDFSGWKEKNSYVFFEGGGARGHSYYTVYKEDMTKSQMKIRGVPAEIQQFCKDGYLHYNYNTLEVLNANDDDKRTGYFIQDQRFVVSDPSGHTKDPFYIVQNVLSREVFDYYAHSDNRVHYNIYGSTGIVFKEDGQETNYVVKDTNAVTKTYGRFIWEKVRNGRVENINRSYYFWKEDKRQIFCVVSPDDTEMWNGDLDGCCLINFYQKNYWYDNCTLFYTIHKQCTFEEAIKKVIENKNDNTKARLEYYQILTEENENGNQTYGNHQMMNAPVGGKSLQHLIDEKKIHNSYGFDMQEWNKEHCSGLDGTHTGMDILARSGANVYAMFDGTIDTVDSSKHILILKTVEDMDFWYCDNHKYPVNAVYSNVKSIVEEGTVVKQGQLIGKVTDNKRCYDDWNIKSTKNYLHITITVVYDDKWELGFKSDNPIEVDPRLLIYRNDNEAI